MIIAWLLVSSLPVYETADLLPRWKTASELIHSRPFPEFSLFDQSGGVVTRRDLEHHIVVANFFFSRCTDVCPRLRRAMASVSDAYPSERALLLLSHTVTPAVDSSDTLAAYAKANGIDGRRWRLLTGDRETIERLEHQAYLVPAATVNKDTAMHSEMMVLLDRHQRVRGVYNGMLQTELGFLKRDIAELLLSAE